MPDGVNYTIKDIRKQLLILDGHLVKELNTKEKQVAAGWQMDAIETKLKNIEKICQQSETKKQ